MKTHFNSISHNLNISFRILQNIYLNIHLIYFFLHISMNTKKTIEKRNLFPLWKIHLKHIFFDNHFSQISSRDSTSENQHPSNHPPCYKIQKSSKLRSSLLPSRTRRRKQWKRKMAKGRKKSHGKRLEKITRGRYLSRHLGSDWVARTFYLRRDWTVANQSIDFTCFLSESGTKAASADRYRADIGTISRRSSRGNLQRGNGKKVRERLPGEELCSTGRDIGYICALSMETVSSFRRQMFLLRNDNLIIIAFNAVEWIWLIKLIYW